MTTPSDALRAAVSYIQSSGRRFAILLMGYRTGLQVGTDTVPVPGMEYVIRLGLLV